MRRSVPAAAAPGAGRGRRSCPNCSGRRGTCAARTPGRRGGRDLDTTALPLTDGQTGLGRPLQRLQMRGCGRRHARAGERAPCRPVGQAVRADRADHRADAGFDVVLGGPLEYLREVVGPSPVVRTTRSPAVGGWVRPSCRKEKARPSRDVAREPPAVTGAGQRPVGDGAEEGGHDVDDQRRDDGPAEAPDVQLVAQAGDRRQDDRVDHQGEQPERDDRERQRDEVQDRPEHGIDDAEEQGDPDR